jgi:predicted ribosomally synthesized peptide with nif11-like leader
MLEVRAMSTEHLEAFEKAVGADASLREEVEQQGDDLAGIVAIGRREGYTFSSEELLAYATSYQAEPSRELNDTELESVTGAGWTSSCGCGDWPEG